MVCKLLDIILPVLDTVAETGIKDGLIEGFSKHTDLLKKVESGFESLTSAPQTTETLSTYFHSWAQTNNSATTVAGIGNRLTLMLHQGQFAGDRAALLQTLTSLDRIIDEDLAVTHRVLHSDMFYYMATQIVGDDRWQSRRYLHPAAKAFKDWKDHNSLRDADPLVALLTTLVHEIYTHGEVEFILPLFQRWLAEDYSFADPKIRQVLTWIKVHTGPTEKDHFFHAINAVQHYTAAVGANLSDYDLDEIIETYLRKKADVMVEITRSCASGVAEMQ